MPTDEQKRELLIETGWFNVHADGVKPQDRLWTHERHRSLTFSFDRAVEIQEQEERWNWEKLNG
jgi:hypothetical protein